jgi:hypothetical protein
VCVHICLCLHICFCMLGCVQSVWRWVCVRAVMRACACMRACVHAPERARGVRACARMCVSEGPSTRHSRSRLCRLPHRRHSKGRALNPVPPYRCRRPHRPNIPIQSSSLSVHSKSKPLHPTTGATDRQVEGNRESQGYVKMWEIVIEIQVDSVQKREKGVGMYFVNPSSRSVPLYHTGRFLSATQDQYDKV